MIQTLTQPEQHVFNCDLLQPLCGPSCKVLDMNGNLSELEIAQEVAKAVNLVQESKKFLFCVNQKLVAPPKILMMGAPASGKGTQCEFIKEHFQVIHLSTGDILRASIKSGEVLGLQAKAYIDRGDLVPDDLIVDVVVKRLQEPDCLSRGWLLDGFPRTESQAQAMVNCNIIPDFIFVLEVPDEQVLRRIAGRRLDPMTGRTYHIDFDPPPSDVEARIIQRSDDTEKTVCARLETYHRHCDAVMNYFVKLNEHQLQSIEIVIADGTQPKALIQEAFAEALYAKTNQLFVEEECTDSSQASESDNHAYFGINMFCMDPKYDSECRELLLHAFLHNPEKQFALVFVPFKVREPSFLNMFTAVPFKHQTRNAKL